MMNKEWISSAEFIWDLPIEWILKADWMPDEITVEGLLKIWLLNNKGIINTWKMPDEL